MNIRPRDNRIVVKKVTKERTESGLYIPTGMDRAQGPMVEGVVVAVGPGGISQTMVGGRDPIGINVGDTVLYMDYGANLMDKDSDTWVVDAQHVCAVVETVPAKVI